MKRITLTRSRAPRCSPRPGCRTTASAPWRRAAAPPSRGQSAASPRRAWRAPRARSAANRRWIRRQVAETGSPIQPWARDGSAQGDRGAASSAFCAAGTVWAAAPSPLRPHARNARRRRMGPEPLWLPGGGSGGRLGPRHSGPVATLCGDMKLSHTSVTKPHRRYSTFFAALQTVSYPSAVLGFMPCRDVGGLHHSLSTFRGRPFAEPASRRRE